MLTENTPVETENITTPRTAKREIPRIMEYHHLPSGTFPHSFIARLSVSCAVVVKKNSNGVAF